MMNRYPFLGFSVCWSRRGSRYYSVDKGHEFISNMRCSGDSPSRVESSESEESYDTGSYDEESSDV